MKTKIMIFCSLAILVFLPELKTNGFDFPAKVLAQNKGQKLIESLIYVFKANSQVEEAGKCFEQKKYLLAISYFEEAIKLINQAESCVSQENLPLKEKKKLRNSLQKQKESINKMKEITAIMILREQLIKELEEEPPPEKLKPKIPNKTMPKLDM